MTDSDNGAACKQPASGTGGGGGGGGGDCAISSAGCLSPLKLAANCRRPHLGEYNIIV